MCFCWIWMEIPSIFDSSSLATWKPAKLQFEKVNIIFPVRYISQDSFPKSVKLISQTRKSMPDLVAQVHLITSNLSPVGNGRSRQGVFPRLFVCWNKRLFNKQKNSAINESKFDFSKVSDDHLSINVCCQLLTVVIIFTPINNVCKWLPVFQAFSGDLWKFLFCAWLKNRAQE